MDKAMRGIIVEVLKEHLPLLGIACRQRAKFEGWLKFELAARALATGCEKVAVESGYESSKCLSDLTVTLSGQPLRIELKTANTNWRIGGTLKKTRPITKNISSVVTDVAKLRRCGGRRLMAFLLFPVPCNDQRWTTYLERICTETGLCLSVEEHSERVEVPLGDNDRCDIVVCCFEVTDVPDNQSAKVLNTVEEG